MRTLDDLALRENDRRAIVAAQRTLREQFPVAAVVLFGSKARGDDTDESDVDLLVLTTRPCRWAEKRAMIAALGPLQREHAVVFSLLIVPQCEWTSGIYQALPIRDEIERDGVAA